MTVACSSERKQQESAVITAKSKFIGMALLMMYTISNYTLKDKGASTFLFQNHLSENHSVKGSLKKHLFLSFL